MKSLTIAVLAVAGIAISIPAVAFPTVFGETHARPAQAPSVQYAQYNPSGIIGLGYKSKKSKTAKKSKTGTTTAKKSKTGTTGQAKSNQ